jgi:hypothetical protein
MGALHTAAVEARACTCGVRVCNAGTRVEKVSAIAPEPRPRAAFTSRRSREESPGPRAASVSTIRASVAGASTCSHGSASVTQSWRAVPRDATQAEVRLFTRTSDLADVCLQDLVVMAYSLRLQS